MEEPKKQRSSKLGWLMFFIALIGWIVTVFQPDIRSWILGRFDDKKSQSQTQPTPPVVEPQSPPSRPEIRLFSELMEYMENEPITDERFKMLEDHLHLVPRDLSLNTLNGIIKLFLPQGDRVKIVRLLHYRLEANYSAYEHETFENLFEPYRLSQLKRMGLLPKKPK